MLGTEKIHGILEKYDKNNLSIATACSHSALQIFNGARKEGLHTIGIDKDRRKVYDAFPLGRPDEYLHIENYSDMLKKDFEKSLNEKNAIVIPHGSFVEYMGAENFLDFEVPTYGNRKVLIWESDREKEMMWLKDAGLDIPKIIDDPEDIDRPVIVKYHGAKGGKGFFVARSKEEYEKRVKEEPHLIQEFVMGTRYYLHYFYSPIMKSGYKMKRGSLQLLSIDRRDETTIDEVQRIGSINELEEVGIYPTFVVTGNMPIVIRESLLPQVFKMGEAVVDKSYELFGGLVGPFCLETVVDDNLNFKTFEISARIVAGTNIYSGGSPYTEYIQPGLSTGQRIAQEIKYAAENNLLDEIIS